MNLSLPLVHEAIAIRSTLDGIALAGDVYRPETSERVPVVLVLSPYFNSGKRGVDARPTVPAHAWLLDVLVPRGYAVVLADLRGTGASEGCMDLGGPGERRDAVDWVEAVAAAPWSSGKVGMIGKSYDGFTALMAAAEAPPQLAAIVPVAPVSDWYRTVGMGGAKYWAWVPLTAAAYNLQIGFEVPRRDGAEATLAERFTHPDCYLANQAHSDDMTGDSSAWYAERDVNPKAASATAAMFYVHGLVDANAKIDHAVPWYAEYGGPKRAWIWQAPHVWPFVENSGRDDFLREVHRFFDHYLKGLPNGVDREMGTVEIQDDRGGWRNESSFPPVDVVPFTLYPAPDGSLSDANPQEATMRFVDDLRQTGGLAPQEESLPDPNDEKSLVWTSAPLARDVHLAGEPVATLRASFSRPAGLLVAYLHDCESESCRLVDRGVLNARHRDGVDAPQVVTPGAEVEMAVRMYPRDWIFSSGHSIRLTVTGGDHAWVYPTGGAGETFVTTGGATQLLLPEDPSATPWTTTWGVDQGEYRPW